MIKDKLEETAITNGRVPDLLGKHNVFSRLASVLIFIAFSFLLYFGFFTNTVINEDLMFYTFVGVWLVFGGNRAVSLFENMSEILKSRMRK